MSFKSKLQKHSQKVQEETKSIGLIAKFTVDAGVIDANANWEDWEKTYVTYGSDDETGATEAMKKSDQKSMALGNKKTRPAPVVRIRVVPDTALNKANFTHRFLRTEAYQENNPYTHKRHSDFFVDHMPDEIEEGKEFWGHLQWCRLPEGEYGGDLSLTDDDAKNETAPLVTYIANKKDALAMLKALRNDEVTQEQLANAAGTTRGYDQVKRSDSNKDTQSALTQIGESTTTSYETLAGFLNVETIEFLKTSLENNGGDIEATALKCVAEPGDLAIALGKPEYFQNLISKTGLEHNEAVIKVANDTGLANHNDLINFLKDVPF